jgi:hypothetical protein
MKRLLVATLLLITVASCRMHFNKTIKGNGNLRSEERNASNLSRIKIRGGINVEVVPGSASLKVEADENLLKYIETRDEDGWIVIKTKDNVNLKSGNPIRVYLSTDKIRDINIAGSGFVKGSGKFTGADKLNIEVAGSGDVVLAVNTPKVNVDIRGSGSVTLAGETKDANIDIAGSGNYMAQDLLTENTDVAIKGSGDARVYADNNLEADLLGSGTVFYKGKARVHSNAAGSGRIKPME